MTFSTSDKLVKPKPEWRICRTGWHFCLFYILIWGRLLSPHWPRTSDIFICCYFSLLVFSRLFSGSSSKKLCAWQDLFTKYLPIVLCHTWALLTKLLFPLSQVGWKKINTLKYPFAHKQAYYGNSHADTNWKYEAQKRISTFTNTHTIEMDPPTLHKWPCSLSLVHYKTCRLHGD